MDWFWRGWFYSIEACDIAIDTVKYAVFDPNAASAAPQGGFGGQRPGGGMVNLAKPMMNSFEDISKIRNRQDKNILFATDVDTTLRDFYWRYARGLEPYDTTRYPAPSFAMTPEALTDAEKAKWANAHLYEITFTNKGGLVMPVIVEFAYEDGTKETERIPAQIWRKNENKFSKVFMTKKKAVSIKLDPMRETADIDESNNSWPTVSEPSKFSIFKAAARSRGAGGGINPMQKAMQKKNSN